MRHKKVGKMFHWKLCEKWAFNKAEKWLYTSQKVLESENYKFLCDFAIQNDKTLEHNRPDITVIDMKSKKCILIKREEKKCTNYSELRYKIAKIWKMIKAEVILVVIGALGTVKKPFEK